MEYRFLGKSGLKVSALSLGAWVTYGLQTDEQVALDCMTAAWEHGVNFFDNAEVYGNGNAEVVMGNAFKRAGWKRSEFVVSTKIFWGGSGVNQRGLSRKHIIEGVNDALTRLQLDYVDLVFCHRPDIYTPIEETVRAMNHVIDQGKAYYWGTSEWSARDITEAAEIARRLDLSPPLMEQPQYNMLCRNRVEKEYLPLYKSYGLGTTIWSPLASGILSGKYSGGNIPEGSRFAFDKMAWLKNNFFAGKSNLDIKDMNTVLQKVDDLKPISSELGCTLPQLALAWCLKNPNVSTVITGASKKEQVHENMKSLQFVSKLTPEILQKIDTILGTKPVPETDWRLF